MKNIKYFLLLIVLFIISMGVTYAYFYITFSGNEDAQNIIATVGNLRINYTSGPEIKLNDIYPGTSLDKEFAVENTGTLDTFYRVVLTDLYNGIERDEMIYSFTCEKFTNYGEVNQESSGNCGGTTNTPFPHQNNSSINNNIYIESGETHVYSFRMHFIETSSAQNYNQNKLVSAVIKIEESVEVFTLRGQLLDSQMNAMPNMTIEVHSDVLTDVTDENGNYEIVGVEVGTHTMFVKDGTNNVVAVDTFTLKSGRDTETFDNEITWERTDNASQLNVVISNNEIDQLVIVDGITAVQYLLNNYESLGLQKISHNATYSQNYPVDDYRYQGANPDNYVLFNNETWRIIGVFSVEDENENVVNRIKLVRSEPLGTMAYTSANNATTTHSSWDIATLSLLLNSGPYFTQNNGATDIECSLSYSGPTPTCNYSTIGLSNSSRALIASTKWYLGDVNDSSSFSNIYQSERGNDVDTNEVVTWNGKVALMYLTDYIYASSGCYNNNSLTITDLSNADCTSTNWLFYGSYERLLNGYCYSTKDSFIVATGGNIEHSTMNNNENVRPVIYLDSNVKFKKGTGKITDKYEL